MIGGAGRAATLVAAGVAGVLAGRWAGPAAAQLLTAGPAQDGSRRMLATAAVALAAAILVWLAGKGLRRALKALHLGWLDRLAGFALGAAAAVLVLALLLGLGLVVRSRLRHA